MASLGKGTGLIALLTGAVMFALGLFFGWLLHRERVERALYEDAVRARDRANTTLAETAARLELANKDMIRLREQLTDAQHGLETRDETIAELEAERSRSGGLTTAGTDGPDVGDGLDEEAEAAANARSRRPTRARSTASPDARLFDQLELDGEVDITEEVALPPLTDRSNDDVDAADVDDTAADGADHDSEPDPDDTDDGRRAAVTLDGEPGADKGAAVEPGADDGAAAEPGSEAGAVVEPERDGDAEEEPGTEVGAVVEPERDGDAERQPGAEDGADVESGGEGGADAEPVTDGGVPAEPEGEGGAEGEPREGLGADAVGEMRLGGGEHTGSATAMMVEPLRAGDGDAAGDPTPTSGIGDTLVVEPTVVEDPRSPTSGEHTGAIVDDLSEDLSTGDMPGAARVAPGDDLRRISGVGPALERMLHAQGITTFRQLASLDDSAIADLRSRSPRLATRLRRGAWVSQARRLHIDTYGDEP